MAIVATSREDNNTGNIVASYKGSYGVSAVDRTGSGTDTDPYKLSGNIDVPEEEGLGVSPLASELLGGRTGAAAAKLLGKGYDAAKLGIFNRGVDKLDDLAGAAATTKNRVDKFRKTGGEVIDGKAQYNTARDKLFQANPKVSGSNIDVPKPAVMGVITDVLGKLSPRAAKMVDTYWARLSSPISKDASARLLSDTTKKLQAEGYSDKAIDKFLNMRANKVSGTGGNIGAATGTLLGGTNND